MTRTKTIGFLLIGVIFIVTSCNDSNFQEVKSNSNQERVIQQIKKFGEIVLTGDTTILEGRLWRMEANLGTQSVNFDTINRVIKIIELDLDKNQYSEIYIQTEAVGSGRYGVIYGLTSNHEGKLFKISFPENDEGLYDSLFNNYGGHDSYQFSHSLILRSFPLYDDNDANCCPSLGEMTIADSLYFENGQFVMRPIWHRIDSTKEYH